MNAGRDDAPRPEAVRTSFEGGGRGRRGTTGLEGVRGGHKARRFGSKTR